MSDDAHRLADATHVLHGPGGSGSWKQLLFVVYVVALLSGIYGFTTVRGLVVTLGPQWRADGLVAPIVIGCTALLLALLVLAHVAGRRRGPVTPDLAWIDLVVGSSIDRGRTLREAWVLPLTGLGAAGTVIGGVLGAALWGGGAAGPGTALTGLLGGLAVGLTLAVLWLAGQLVSDPAHDAPLPLHRALALALRPVAALRRLGLEGLREHSARSSRLGGALLAGDPRALRLEAASPVRRGRTWRLRSRGPFRTVLARDVLGLRRQPVLLAGGALGAVAGGAGLGWSIAEGSAPLVALALSVLVAHLGAGFWGEGVRLLGDTLGAPRLLGGSVRQEALAHTTVPLVLFLVIGGAGCLLTTAAFGGSPAAALAAVGIVALVSAAAQWVQAFRVLPPTLTQLPENGPAVLLLWLAWPGVLATVVGTFLVDRVLALVRDGSVTGLAWAVLAAAFLGWLAVRSLRRASEAHRD